MKIFLLAEALTLKKIFSMKSRILRVDDEIELRGCQSEYASHIFSIVEKEREYLREWLPWVDMTTEEKHTKNYLKGAHQMNMGGQQLNAWIFYKGELCGSISYVKIDKEHDFGEIGYWLSKAYMGKGIMTKCCERLTRYGFEKLGLERVEIRVAKDNKPSAAIPERLGFHYEGLSRRKLKIRGVYHDLHQFSMLKEDFKC